MAQWNAMMTSCGLSLAVVLLVGVPLSRTRQEERVYSAALGIIIFCCVKLLLVECGWGFASLFGVGTGVTIQLMLVIGCFFFFRQLRETKLLPTDGFFVYRCGMLLCVGVGQTGWRAEETGENPDVYMIGEALQFALLLLAAGWMEEGSSQRNIGRWAASVSVVFVLKATGVWLLRIALEKDGAFAGLLLLTLGINGLLSEFTYAVSWKKELSPSGFAVGLMTAFCADALMG